MHCNNRAQDGDTVEFLSTSWRWQLLMAFTNEQMERYSRHHHPSGSWREGTEEIVKWQGADHRAGGLGAPAAMYLAAAGVGTIGIVDADEVDLSNLQRQIIHGTADVGKARSNPQKDHERHEP